MLPTGSISMTHTWGRPRRAPWTPRHPKVSLMPDIFVDTAGWGHLVDATQAYHHRAATIYRGARQQGRTFITTNYILTELVALLISPLRIPHTHIVAFI